MAEGARGGDLDGGGFVLESLGELSLGRFGFFSEVAEAGGPPVADGGVVSVEKLGQAGQSGRAG